MSSSWDDSTELLTRAQAARAQGDHEMAYQLYARATELNPQDATAWQGRAETAPSHDETLIGYAYASALDPTNKPLADTLDAALAKRVQDAKPEDAPLLIVLGQELAELGFKERGRALLERASGLDPTNTDALVWLAGVSADDQAQLDYLNRALMTNPRDPRARAGLLSVKLPPAPAAPPSPPPVESAGKTAAGARPSAAVRPVTPPAPFAPAARKLETPGEDPAMERLRKLRAHVPPPDSPAATAPSPVDDLRNLGQSNNTRIRNILILLIVLVIVLALAGFALMQLQ